MFNVKHYWVKKGFCCCCCCWMVVNIGHDHRDGIQTYKWKNRCKWNGRMTLREKLELPLNVT